MNTLNQNILYQRGSKWRKWDLHIHSPFSYGGNYENFITNLKKSDVAVAGINDYYSISGYEKILEDASIKNKVLLPIIEFRMNNIILDKNDKRADKGVKINFHIIFSNKIKLNFIKTWLNSLDCLYKGGKKEKLGNIKDSYDERLKLSFDYFYVLDTLAKDENLKDYFLVWLPYDEYGGVDNINPNTDKYFKLGLINQAHIIGSSNKKQIDFFLWKSDNYSEEQIEKWLNKRKIPCIKGSDSHEDNYPFGKLQDENSKPVDKYCWIKANPTFEGLKQIIHEPKDRVKIQENNPEPLKSSCSIDSIKISDANINKNLSIKTIEIPVNHNLVAVIGGKGSGKTALLDLIANCYPDKIDPSNKNSFVSRIFSEGQNLNTNIEFLNKEKFSKKLNEEKFINNSDIEYIPQGQIENKIGNTTEFHNFLQNLIFKSDKVKNSIAYFEYQENEKNKKELKNKIETLNQEVFTIETQIKNENIDNIDRQIKLKETEKIDIQGKINLTKKLFTKEKLDEISKIQSELSIFKDRRNKLSNLSHLIKDTIEKFIEVENLNKNLEAIKNLADELKLKDVAAQTIKYKDIKDQIENIQNKVVQELSVISKNIEKAQNKIEKLQKDKKEYVVLLNKLKEIDTAINSLKSKQKNITELQRSLSERMGKRWELYKQLLNTDLILRKKYEELIGLFSKDAYEILSGIEFKSSLIFDFKKFVEMGEDILDLRTVRESKTQKVSLLESELFKDIINALREITKTESNDSGVDKLTEVMKQKIAELLKTKKSTRTNEHLYEWFFDDYFSLNTETYFNKIFLEKLSLGQKCTVLLKVYLAQGENPIFIDQPDDNLDNEFIMRELIQAIRKAKTNRQVIIASNNANVVINSDAEQIIVAEYKNGEIFYTLGAIEEPIIREKAIHILEGGRIAFEAREKKYDFK